MRDEKLVKKRKKKNRERVQTKRGCHKKKKKGICLV
jgi:hypothetical protein